MTRTSRTRAAGCAVLLVVAPVLPGCDWGGTNPGAAAPAAIVNTIKGPDDKGHTQYANGVAFSPDGKLLATTGQDQTLKLWDAGSGRVLATLDAHTAAVRDVAFTPD